MRVLVTGGSGFVGAHAVAALLASNHSVRVFARKKQRVGEALRLVGASPDQVEVIEGDLTRPETIGPALAGMEAVVHAASVYSYDPRDGARIGEVNLAGTRALLDAAVAAGLDPVVHVSSMVALLPARSAVLGPDSPPGDSDPMIAPYSASKSAQERHARALQDHGAPVVTVMPGAVWGPHDPYEGESVRLARAIARRQMVLSVRGGFTCVDVRDVAAVLAAVVDHGPGRGARRYTAGGHWLTVADLHRLIGAELGRRLPTLPGPPRAAMVLARGARWLQGRVGPRLPIGTEQVFVVDTFAPADDTSTMEHLGVTFRPFARTLQDQLAWQQAAGRL